MTEKNRRKMEAKKQRCLVPFNIGVRTMKTEKDYNRREGKAIARNYMRGEM